MHATTQHAGTASIQYMVSYTGTGVFPVTVEGREEWGCGAAWMLNGCIEEHKKQN